MQIIPGEFSSVVIDEFIVFFGIDEACLSNFHVIREHIVNRVAHMFSDFIDCADIIIALKGVKNPLVLTR